jgi:HK97 family phage major capsid protein
MSIQNLRERKNELARAANKLIADLGDKTWTKEQQAEFDNLTDEAERVSAQIAAHQKMLDQRANDNPPQNDPNAPKNERTRGLELFLRKSFKDLTPEEAIAVRNTMSTTTGSQGGYTVQTEVAKTFVDAMKDYGGMRRVSGRIVTDSGNDLSYPTTDGTAETGEIVAQNTQASSADASFGTVPLNTVKFGSKIITIPIELLQDSAIDVISLVQKRLRDRIGRIQNTKFTNGSGTGEPYGLTTAASVGKTGATGQTSTVTYDDLVDMVDSVDQAYLTEGSFTWQFAQTTRRVVRKLKDQNGRPIWTPSYDEGITQNTPDLLLGYPVNINNDMPAMGANNTPISFGQHAKYLIRDAMEVVLFRFDDSAYMSKGQVGFLAWARAGGNLLDTAAVKLYKNSAT